MVHSLAEVKFPLQLLHLHYLVAHVRGGLPMKRKEEQSNEFRRVIAEGNNKDLVCNSKCYLAKDFVIIMYLSRADS